MTDYGLGPFPPGDYIVGVDLTTGVRYRPMEGIPGIFTGWVEQIQVFGAGSDLDTAVDGDVVRVKSGCLAFEQFAGVEAAYGRAVRRGTAVVRHDSFAFPGVAPWTFTTGRMAFNAGDGSWLAEYHKGSNVVKVRQRDHTWLATKVVGNQGRFYSAYFTQVASPSGFTSVRVTDGKFVGESATHVKTGSGNAGELAFSEATVHFTGDLDYHDVYTYLTFDVQNLNSYLRGRDITNITGVSLVFWISGYHRDYIISRDGDTDDNDGVGFDAAVRNIHFASATCPVVSDGGDFRVSDEGVRGADIATLSTFMGGPDDTTVDQMVVVPIDLSADHVDFTLWLDPEKDTPVEAPDFDPDPGLRFSLNWSRTSAFINLASVLIETSA